MKNVAFFTSLFVFQTMCSAQDSEMPAAVVDTELGRIQGSMLQTLMEKQFYAFRGIRYGKAPVDELRFKAPIPVEPWIGIFDATNDGPMCVQRKKGTNEMSEDCLRLNVYTQELPQGEKTLQKPVLVYIHGGSYYIGSGLSNHYGGPYYLMDQDIVLVTINYRLGLLGFLSLGIAECPGNAGFKDQVLALKWVQTHIAKFGGDPNKVTVMGHSAGGMSIAHHMVSPMSKGLFHQVATMSGATMPQYTYTTEQVDLARRQCPLLGCPSNLPVEEMLQCLRQVNIDEFAGSVHSMFEFGKDNPAILWNAVVEPDFGQKRFLIDDPNKLLATRYFEKMPVLVGVTKDELVSAAVAVIKSPNLLESFDLDFDKVAPICFFYERDTNKSQEVSATLREAYKLNHPLAVDSLERINEIFSDGIIGFGVHRFVNLVKTTCPTFYYRFSYKGRYSHLYYPRDEPYGAEHLDDMIYLLVESHLAPIFSKDSPEVDMIGKMTTLVGNFVKTGNPNSEDSDPEWLPTDATNDSYLDIDTNVTLKSEKMFADRYLVWDQLFPQ